jgi:hypothetical protein
VQPEHTRGLDCELSIPVSAEAHNLMVPKNDLESFYSWPHVRITVTKVQDGSTATLYEGKPDDFDGVERILYEWNHMAGVVNGAFFALVNSLNLGVVETPMIQVVLEMDSDDGDDDDDHHHTRGGILLLRPAIDTEGDAIGLSTDQFIALLEHCVDFRS